MEAVEAGQRYIARPEFSAVESSSFGKGAKKAKQLVGKVIHVNQRHRHVTLEFDVAMGKIRETIAISDLGKRV